MKAELGIINSDELLTEIGFEDTAFHMKNYLENHLTVDKEFFKFAENRVFDGRIINSFAELEDILESS